MIGQSSPTDPQDAFAQTLRALQARIDDLERRKPTAFSVSGGLLSMTVSGTVTAANLAGSGSAITNLNASNLASGTVPSARVSGAYGSITGVGTLTGLVVSSATIDHTKSLGAGAGYYFESRSGAASGYGAWYRSGTSTYLYDSSIGVNVMSQSGTAITFGGNVATTNGYFNSQGSNAAFFSRDRDGTARDAGLYMNSSIGYLYHSSYGNVLNFNSAGIVNIPLQLNLSNGIYASGGGYTGRAAAAFGPFSTDNRAPALLSGAGTNWIHFNWDGSAFRCYVDSTLVKTFVIDHPIDPDKLLVHACAEGPTADVFYRGEARLIEGIVRIDLPDYFESLTELEGRTVQITPIIEHGEAWKTASLAASRVEDGSFWVFQAGGCTNNEQPFWWRVDAVRNGTTFTVEPNRADVTVAGSGPYTYITQETT